MGSIEGVSGVSGAAVTATPDYAPLLSLLVSLGLAQFGDMFMREMITLQVARQLSEKDLIDLGLPLGVRRILQSAFGSIPSSVVSASSVTDYSSLLATPSRPPLSSVCPTCGHDPTSCLLKKP